MKTKYILIFLLVAGVTSLFSSCKKSFLEVEPIGLELESNYYNTPEQVFNGLVAAYSNMSSETDYGINWYANKLAPLNAAADECYAGGGGESDMASYQVWDNYTLTAADGPQSKFWDMDYSGIYRCNLMLQKLQNDIPGLGTDLKNRYIAECKALRAYYYFELIRLFKNIPLFTDPVPTDAIYDQVQAKPEDVFALIEKDLKEAEPVLPPTVPSTENGRLTKGAAQAMLGKVILWQNNTARMLEAADWFNKVNTSGIYQLLANYPDIFSPAYKYNKESILEIGHSGSQQAWWGTGDYRGNIYSTMVGPRSYSAGPGADSDHTYYSGWSFNPIIKSFATSIHDDPRYKYTVADLDSLKKLGQADYMPGYKNTGLFIQKYAPLLKWKAAVGEPVLNWPNNVIEIRLADTYLMEAEALVRGGGSTARAQALLDAVRDRVKLPSKPATLDNIYEERRLELATEGHRWFDLVRTGKAATVLAFKGFVAGKHELLPIPLNDLNNTKLVQNPLY